MSTSRDRIVANISTGDRQVDDAVRRLSRAVTIDPVTAPAGSRRVSYDAALLWLPCTASDVTTGGSASARNSWTMSSATPAIYYVTDSILGSGSMLATPTIGTRQYTTCSVAVTAFPGTKFRASCWVTVRNFMGGTAAAIWGKKVSAAAGWVAQRQFDFTLSAAGVPMFTLTTGAGTTTITGDYALQRGIPYHLEGSYDANTIRFFVNGLETGTSVVDGTAVPWGNGPFYAWNFPDAAAPDNPFAGYLEECVLETMQSASETVPRTRYLRGLYGIGVT